MTDNVFLPDNRQPADPLPPFEDDLAELAWLQCADQLSRDCTGYICGRATAVVDGGRVLPGSCRAADRAGLRPPRGAGADRRAAVRPHPDDPRGCGQVRAGAGRAGALPGDPLPARPCRSGGLAGVRRSAASRGWPVHRCRWCTTTAACCERLGPGHGGPSVGSGRPARRRPRPDGTAERPARHARGARRCAGRTARARRHCQPGPTVRRGQGTHRVRRRAATGASPAPGIVRAALQFGSVPRN